MSEVVLCRVVIDELCEVGVHGVQVAQQHVEVHDAERRRVVLLALFIGERFERQNGGVELIAVHGLSGVVGVDGPDQDELATGECDVVHRIAAVQAVLCAHLFERVVDDLAAVTSGGTVFELDTLGAREIRVTHSSPWFEAFYANDRRGMVKYERDNIIAKNR